jgi:hypothetical protein
MGAIQPDFSVNHLKTTPNGRDSNESTTANTMTLEITSNFSPYSTGSNFESGAGGQVSALSHPDDTALALPSRPQAVAAFSFIA